MTFSHADKTTPNPTFETNVRSKFPFVRNFFAIVFAMYPILLAIRSIQSYDAFVETLPEGTYVSGTPFAMALLGASLLVPICAVVGLVLGIVCEKLIGLAQRSFGGKHNVIQS